MNDNFKEFDTAPVLTLDPFGAVEETKEEVVEVQEKPWDETVLSREELQMVESFTKQIDLRNSNMILQYGAGTQKKMADFSQDTLESVKTKDLGEVGDLLSGVVTELKSFDEEEEKDSLGFLRRLPIK